MRDTSAALCAEFTRAGTECFQRWCALLDSRAKPSPDAVVASQAALHEAARRLREWCLADPAEAEAERQDLMVRQVEGQLAAEAAIQARRTAEDRGRIRSSWVTAVMMTGRSGLLTLPGISACGCGTRPGAGSRCRLCGGRDLPTSASTSPSRPSQWPILRCSMPPSAGPSGRVARPRRPGAARAAEGTGRASRRGRDAVLTAAIRVARTAMTAADPRGDVDPLQEDRHLPR